MLTVTFRCELRTWCPHLNTPSPTSVITLEPSRLMLLAAAKLQG
jgi:hypothetical protein